MDRKNYMLVIAEKPDAAQRVAEALDEKGKPTKRLERNYPYFELQRSDRRIVVAPASGHLYTIMQQRGGRNYYPVYTFKWVPKYRAERNASRTRNIIDAIAKLSVDANEFVNAADYDVEGSLIGYMILKHACGGKEKEAKRMKFSTLTRGELNQAFENMMPHLDFQLAEAGQTRHEVDWVYGINLSRALTLSAVKQNNRYTTLSIGRVQGPTLKLIVQREIEIRSFVPVPYWQIDATVEIEGKPYKAAFEQDRINRKAEAEEIQRRCSEKIGRIEDIEEKKIHRTPPEPFDLGTLQKEAYRFFGYTPRRTLDVAERLYLDALISYPRTSSQKLPPSINYRGVLEGLLRLARYSKFAAALLQLSSLKPNEGRRHDPAHPAVYPTGNVPGRDLPSDQAKVYDLVVKRFMATFGPPSIRLSTKVSIQCEGYAFFMHGRRIVDEGWTAFYHPYAEADEVILPRLTVGESVNFRKVENIECFTQPQPRYNPASLLKVMEENNIGTKATRAEIIDTLYGRGYLRGERVVATDLGFTVIDTLNKYCTEVTSVELTRNLEEKMEQIESQTATGPDVLLESVGALHPTLIRMKSTENAIG
ncbi:MAG: DNA topoisomerase I, partial [Candidatus Bathyarchaeia archaeon]